MKWMLISLGALMFLLIAGFVGAGVMMSNEYEVERSIVIPASPDAIHAWVGELRKWPEWTAWATDKNVFAGKTKGVGGSYRWTSQEGDGELTFTAWDPAHGVVYDLRFLGNKDPFVSRGSLSYSEEEAGTRVSWRMHGTIDGAIVGSWRSLLMNKLVGPGFEVGLANLKREIEAGEVANRGDRADRADRASRANGETSRETGRKASTETGN